MQLEMQVSQEKERRVFFEQSQKGGSDEKYLKKIGQLESKISEYRHNEVKFEAEIKQMEEELESKDDQIDNLLANLENNELVEQMVKLSAEKDELEQELERIKLEKSGTSVQNFEGEDVEYELRTEINDLTHKLQCEREEKLKDLESFKKEELKLQEAINIAENRAKDFEYMVAEVEYKLQKERTESKEDQLKDEVRRLQKEIDALGNHQNQIKSESTDLVTENKALSIQVEKYQKKASTNEFLFKQSGMERDKLLSKLAGADKEISTLHEKVKEKDNKIIELTKKIVESEASHMQTIEKKEGEYLQALKKSQLELQIAHYQIKKMQDEAESAMVRTKNETLLVPQFDNAQQKPASGTMMVDMSMSNLMALPIFTISEVENTAETQDKTIDQIDSSIENNDLVLEERSRKGSFALQMVGSNGPLRKDTGDSRFNGSSAAQSRRDSLQSNRFVRKGLVFGAKTSDAKLQAEVNELRIKLKEAHQECSNKSELDEKSNEIKELSEALDSKQDVTRGDELKVMEEKFKKEALETEIKNLKAELVHLNKEYDYCSQAAAESSVKLACICQDYEVNQMALMKKNRSVVGYANEALKCISSVEQAVNSEKISSKVISAALKTFQQVAKVI